MKDNIFREYDIRGIVGKELNIEKSYELGKAIVTYLKKQNPSLSTIIVGRDGRDHSKPINDLLISGVTDLGINVIDIGLSPTPALYFAIHHLNIPTGLTITASHNPKEYNGIKIWGTCGEDIQEIKKIFNEKQFYNNQESKGTVKSHDIVTDYINYLTKHFAHLKNKSIKAVIDCGNGSAGIVMPRLIQAMNWSDVKLLFPEVDGNFPNHEADPTVPQNMVYVKKELKHNVQFNIGIGFDGDCDRMSPMTKSGYLVPGDKLLAIYAQKILLNHPNATIVFDIKSSSGLIELLEQWKAKPMISPSGHSIIKKAIKKHNAILAGELSCHFFFNDRYFGYDDGIYAALRLFEILQDTKKNLEELLRIFPKKINSPEIRIKCKTEEVKKQIVDHVKSIFAARKDANVITIDGVRAQMEYGWGLVRASNTQPVICLRFESKTNAGIKKVKEDFYESLTPFFDKDKLKKTIEL